MKDILVQLDGGSGAAHRLDLAIGLARRMDARLIGLFAQEDSDAPSLVARRPSAYLQAAAEEAARQFHSRAGAAGVAGQWWRLAHGESAYVISETVFCARYADLAILGQWQAGGGKVPEQLAEQMVAQSGRPVLLIPESGAVTRLGDHICIGWNASREASRALHDAMPFLERAAEVTVLAIRGDAGPPEARPPGEPPVDIVAHLARHGIKARSERLSGEDIGVMDILLSRAFDLGADMLVMGAHSGQGVASRRGAGTKFMLRHQTLPILMSN